MKHLAQLATTALLAAFFLAADDAPRKDPPQDNQSPKKVVYVLDASAAMQPSFALIQKQQNTAVTGLHPSSKYTIVLTCNGKVERLDDKLLGALPAHQKKAIAFIEAAKAGGKADLPKALETALKYEPEVIFLLCSDNADAKLIAEAAAKFNPQRKVKINCVAVDTAGSNPDKQKTLKDMAVDSGGVYMWLSVKDLEEMSKDR